jgi:hypothetical protein
VRWSPVYSRARAERRAREKAERDAKPKHELPDFGGRE